MVRSRWAPPPTEGEGPREGQRMAIGQWAPPAAEENITPKASCQPPPPPPCLNPPATDGETETADQNSGLVDLH